MKDLISENRISAECHQLLTKLNELELQKFSIKRKLKKGQYKKSSDFLAAYKNQIAAIDSEIISLNRAFTKLRSGAYYVEQKMIRTFIH